MIFLTKKSKVYTNFQSLLSNAELLTKTQQETCVIGSRKVFDISLPILTESTEKLYIENLIYLIDTYFFAFLQ